MEKLKNHSNKKSTNQQNSAGLLVTRKYHILIYLLLSVMFLFIQGCTPDITPTTGSMQIIIQVDGSALTVEVSPGDTVQDALEEAEITLGNLDRIDPGTYTVLTDSITINITRISEEFDVEENVIPFTRQTVRNESLPEGDTLLIQPGINGNEQITYRKLFENGIEVSRTVFKTEIIQEAKPEIIMVGVQTPFTSVPIEGKLVYLTAGNAWVMEENTRNRRPLVTTGDLDGRVFSLSPDGEWLLFTRQSDREPTERINNLSIVNVNVEDPEPIYIKANNVVHFAGWVPDATRTIVYSTVEPRATPPGWQANNDLYRIVFDKDGNVLQIKEIVEANSGGIYGWWGTQYALSSDGKRSAYAQPDSIGLVDVDEGTLEPLLNIIPFQTGSDWAWVPGLGWSSDHRVLYTVVHTPKFGLASDEASPIFDLVAIVPGEDLIIPLVEQCGMFAYPVPSPTYANDRNLIAYLQALLPEQSETSRYRLMIIDRDGSNQQALFPPEGSPGIEPQQVAWEPIYSDSPQTIALIYQGNLWLIYPTTGDSQQITGDGSINRMDWK